MAFRVNGTSPMVKTEVSTSIASIASAQVATKVVTVSGVTTDMCIDAVFASAHSALAILECQVLSTNNVQLAIWNYDNAAHAYAGTFRFVSK